MTVSSIFYLVGTWFSRVWSLVFGFYQSIGFLGVIIAMLFIVSIFRFFIAPLIGTFRLDQDTVKRAYGLDKDSWSGKSRKKD